MDKTAQLNEQILAAALNVGERLLECGGNVSRVEDTIRRICTAYGATRTDVFAITSSIVVTMERDGHTATQTRRISGGETDFARLEALHVLSRKICAEKPLIEELPGMIAGTDNVRHGGIWLQLAGYVMAASAFAVFFRGDGSDAFCAGIGAVLIWWMDRKVKPHWQTSKLLYAMLCSFIAGILAVVCGKFAVCAHTEMVMIGDIMLLIPGIALTNALRDLFVGDTISGVLRLSEAVLHAGVIACGFALAILAGGLLG